MKNLLLIFQSVFYFFIPFSPKTQKSHLVGGFFRLYCEMDYFTKSTIALKADGLFIARSASTLRSSSILLA